MLGVNLKFKPNNICDGETRWWSTIIETACWWLYYIIIINNKVETYSKLKIIWKLRYYYLLWTDQYGEKHLKCCATIDNHFKWEENFTRQEINCAFMDGSVGQLRIDVCKKKTKTK